ncbi:MAG: hypothetical protein GTO22_03275 [Gemmatimonadales bacterium]|nr:hypothetical protein [Gemmatimonadales bacterium]
MTDRQSHAGRLAALGADADDLEALLDYTSNHFSPDRVAWPVTLPLDSEPHLEVWQEYADTVRQAGSIAPLADAFPQLCFPIAQGISRTPEYISATRQGVSAAGTAELRLGLARPNDVRLLIHDTAAGQVPLLVVRDRGDFVRLVQAFAKRNEPAPVPDSQGACMVAGYNNWDRVGRYRAAWQAEHGGQADWGAEFKRMAARKELYQDRFVILSDGPYSAVTAADIGMEEPEWRTTSLAIRRDHECAHYLTKRVFGSMKDRLHDELIADFAGITAVEGRYRADWFLRFMGLEHYPTYRTGGRLENYRGTPPLSARAFVVVQTLVTRAAQHLDRFCAALGDSLEGTRERATIMVALASLTLDQMASAEAERYLEQAVSEARRRIRWQADLNQPEGTVGKGRLTEGIDRP